MAAFFLNAPYIDFDNHAETMLMTLQPGRNTILAKVINQRGLPLLSLRSAKPPLIIVRAFVERRKVGPGHRQLQEGL